VHTIACAGSCSLRSYRSWWGFRSTASLPLATLQCLYNNDNNTQCIVKGPYSLSEPFSVTCGVRQGCPSCPLSTTLFNLFISDLHDYITQRCQVSECRCLLALDITRSSQNWDMLTT
jgi:hypothetical protein